MIMGEKIMQIPIPCTAELCCVVAEIDLKETQDSSAKTDFHWKTFKCRLILDTMRDSVIACPIYQAPSSINIITSVEFFKSQVLQKNLSEMNITWSTPRPVTPDVYANCLRYSILFAIAPQWNRAGQYLIAGKYFLMNTDQTYLAMRFNLTLQSSDKMTLNAIVKVQPLKIKQCGLSLEDVGIPHEVIAHFMAEPEGKINVTSFGNYRVTVLPSLKKGKLMAVFRKIPASCPFKNYGELRRHWKNMYGYRLPESDIGIIYYEVYFGIPDSPPYLYPHLCVRTRLIETSYLGDREAVVQSFLEDVTEAVPTICGQSFNIIKNSGNFGKATLSLKSYFRVNKHPEEINKTANNNLTFPRTPERKANPGFAPKNVDDTTRFSFSSRLVTPKNHQLLRRDLSSLMSPTPSLRGNFRSAETSANRLRGILTSSIRDPKSTALRMPRMTMTDNNPIPESQNCCPNAAEIEQRKVQEDKLALMEIERVCNDKTLPPIFMPVSCFASSSRDINDMSSIFVPLKCEQDLLSDTKMKNLSQDVNQDVVSQYFDTQSGSNEESNHPRVEDREASQTSRKIPLLEKLRRNMKSKSEPTTWN